MPADIAEPVRLLDGLRFRLLGVERQLGQFADVRILGGQRVDADEDRIGADHGDHVLIGQCRGGGVVDGVELVEKLAAHLFDGNESHQQPTVFITRPFRGGDADDIAGSQFVEFLERADAGLIDLRQPAVHFQGNFLGGAMGTGRPDGPDRRVFRQRRRRFFRFQPVRIHREKQRGAAVQLPPEQQPDHVAGAIVALSRRPDFIEHAEGKRQRERPENDSRSGGPGGGRSGRRRLRRRLLIVGAVDEIQIIADRIVERLDPVRRLLGKQFLRALGLIHRLLPRLLVDGFGGEKNHGDDEHEQQQVDRQHPSGEHFGFVFHHREAGRPRFIATSILMGRGRYFDFASRGDIALPIPLFQLRDPHGPALLRTHRRRL